MYGANSGDSAIAKINGAINQAILCLRSEHSNSFTCHFLTFKKDWIVSRFIQGGQGNLSGDIVKSISIPFPHKEEQQKIAECLSSLDKVITAHSQKLEALKEHKKGLMQSLFPQEGETVPKWRFPEFAKDGEWVEKKLGDIFNISAGGDIDKENVSEVKTDFFKYPIYANAEKKKGLYGYSNTFKVDENVITVAGRGVNIGIAHARNHKFYPIVRVLVLKPLNNESIYFFEYLINRLELHGESTGVPQLTAPQISLYTVFFPSPPEQQKIASCISSLDEVITAQADKIEQLKLHKKGLMQGLFPKIDD